MWSRLEDTRKVVIYGNFEAHFHLASWTSAMRALHTTHLSISRHSIILCSAERKGAAVYLSTAQRNYSNVATVYPLATSCMPLAGIHRLGSNGAGHQEG